MIRLLPCLAAAALLLVAPARAQDPDFSQKVVAAQAAPSPTRLAAGVREYPARVLRALLTLAEHPLVVRQLAEEPELLDSPEKIYPPVSNKLGAAVKELQNWPSVVAIAAAHPTALQALRRLYEDAPEGVELRILQLREGFERSAVAAAGAWQKALETDPVAFGEYRDLLTKYCNARRAQQENFPYVHAAGGEYYYACPPDAALMSFAAQNAPSPSLGALLESWWIGHGPSARDAKVLTSNAKPVDIPIDPRWIAALPAEKRAALWKPPAPDVNASLGLVPVIMQPLADQPADARREFALVEHDRLWGPIVGAAPPAVALAPRAGQVAPEPPPVAARPFDDRDEPVRLYDSYGRRYEYDRYRSYNYSYSSIYYGSPYGMYYPYPYYRTHSYYSPLYLGLRHDSDRTRLSFRLGAALGAVKNRPGFDSHSRTGVGVRRNTRSARDRSAADGRFYSSYGRRDTGSRRGGAAVRFGSRPTSRLGSRVPSYSMRQGRDLRVPSMRTGVRRSNSSPSIRSGRSRSPRNYRSGGTLRSTRSAPRSGRGSAVRSGSGARRSSPGVRRSGGSSRGSYFGSRSSRGSSRSSIGRSSRSTGVRRGAFGRTSSTRTSRGRRP